MRLRGDHAVGKVKWAGMTGGGDGPNVQITCSTGRETCPEPCWADTREHGRERGTQAGCCWNNGVTGAKEKDTSYDNENTFFF